MGVSSCLMEDSQPEAALRVCVCEKVRDVHVRDTHSTDGLVTDFDSRLLVTNLGKRTARLQTSGTELVGDSAAEPEDGTAQELT